MSDRYSEQWINIKFYMKLGKNASDTCAVLSGSYGGEAMKKSSVSEWQRRFKEGHKNVEDDEISDPQISHKTNETVEKVRNLVHLDGRLSINQTLKQLCEAMRRNRPELWPSDWIFHYNNAPPHKALFF
jgi:hypothetical protein